MYFKYYSCEQMSQFYESVSDGSMSAPLEKLSKKKWNLYSFRLDNEKLKYFKSGVR